VKGTWRLPSGKTPQQLWQWATELIDQLRKVRSTDLPSYTVATAPDVSPAGQLIFVTDETGGAVVAFSDGTDWRRVTDRAVIA
jgi:hypothetical protein